MNDFAAIGTSGSIHVSVRNFIVENFLFGDSDELTDGDSLLANGVLDSTGVVELIGFLEERFDIVVDDHEMVPENLDSIARIAGFVQEKVGPR